jgi:hypothetical protein
MGFDSGAEETPSDVTYTSMPNLERASILRLYVILP